MNHCIPKQAQAALLRYAAPPSGAANVGYSRVT